MHVAEKVHLDLQDLPVKGGRLCAAAQKLQALGEAVAVGHVFAAVPDARPQVFRQREGRGKAGRGFLRLTRRQALHAAQIVGEHVLIGDGVLAALAGHKGVGGENLQRRPGWPFWLYALASSVSRSSRRSSWGSFSSRAIFSAAGRPSLSISTAVS